MRVYNISASHSFVDTLAAGVLDMVKDDPSQLTAATILLPNRRAVRALTDAFLRLSDGKPLLLPNIRPIGDVEEDEILLSATHDAFNDIPPAIPNLRRRIILARYLLASPDYDFTFAQSLDLASDLGRLLDSVHTEGLTLDNLDHLVTGELAKHWQVTLSFLNDVLRVHWPEQLKSEGCIDPGLHRRLMIEAYTRHLTEIQPKSLFIAAGSTGSIPVTAALLKTIATLPNGMVVLPGLDTHLADDDWNDIEEGHPQATLSNLLTSLNITRHAVTPWPHNVETNTSCEQLISEIMRPAQSTSKWKNLTGSDISTFDHLTLLEADNLDEEALSIALIMRKHADDTETKEPCVLVTPDRFLAGRVTQLLGRWGVKIDDSAGQPLSQTNCGLWLLSLADILVSNMAPIAFLNCVQNTLASGGADWPKTAPPFRNFVRMLDQYLLRGMRSENAFDGLYERLNEHKRLSPETHDALHAGLTSLEKLFKPVFKNTDNPLRQFILLAESLSSTKDINGERRLWSGEDGEACAKSLADLLEQADVLPELSWQDCADLIKVTLASMTVRPRYGTHPRLAILGAIEARLYQAKTMILGSLNEGTWPAISEVDGWMSRPMRRDFGLPAPERSITLSAHDFCQGMGAENVIITRAKMRDGAPTIPSRWLQRLDAVSSAMNAPDIRKNAQNILQLSRNLDAPNTEATPIKRPTPCPDIDKRPLRLSVTEIANLRRDPYGIYARHILKLRPWDDIDAEPDAAHRGTLVHAALEQFAREFSTTLPNDALDKLLTIGQKVFDDAHHHPDIIGHWWPRFIRMASAFVAHEITWRTNETHIVTEAKAEMPIQIGDKDFTLVGRADRIETRNANKVAIIDYKTGIPPTAKKVETGFEPQLTLLGAMVLCGLFNETLNTKQTPDIDALAYWPVGGNTDLLKPVRALPKAKGDELEQLCRQAKDGLVSLLGEYLTQGIAYQCWPDAHETIPPYYEYLHLERVSEWHTDIDDEGSEAA